MSTCVDDDNNVRCASWLASVEHASVQYDTYSTLSEILQLSATAKHHAKDAWSPPQRLPYTNYRSMQYLHGDDGN